MIESGRIDEAIAHCRHILKSFPKHIDTYRLLGKAYLESQRYSDAADILQRTLSAVPDDFVSHLGMSIIREDEGNLDEAIWHMERAFEIQPANGAIQDELRRLYGRRDGLEPPKVRLTRGALARMYAKGDLQQQAIAELRAGLADDPQRFDLQVLLARVLAQSGQRGEAANTSSAILHKLPYCLEANRIMTEVVSEGEPSEETQAFRQRVISMDPYAAYISSSASTADRVPDQAVVLERLDWKAVRALPGGQPEWAASLGVRVDSPEEQESMPDWLSATSNEPPAQTGSQGKEIPTRPRDPGASSPWEAPPPAPKDLPPAEPNTEDRIPDWMKAAGWQPSTGAFDESKSPFIFDENEPAALGPDDTGDLPSAEIPEWLRAMAPPEAQAEIAGEPEIAFDGLEEIAGSEELPGSGPSAEAVPDGLTQDTAAAGTISSLDWKGDMEQESSESTPASGDFSAEVPDWLKEVNQEASNVSESEQPHDDVPDWLKEIGQEAQVSAAEPAGLPDWLQEAGPTDTTGSEQQKPEAEPTAEPEAEWAAEPAAEVPDWLKEMAASEAPAAAPTDSLPDWLSEAAEEPAAEPAAPEPQPSGELDDDAAFAWLESLAVKQGATDALLLSEEERQETPPEWVQNAALEAEESAADQPVADQPSAEEFASEEPVLEEMPAGPMAEPPGEAVSSPDLPAWLQEMAPPTTAASDLPDWLAEQDENLPAGAGEEGAAEPAGSAEMPEWLKEMSQQKPPFAPTEAEAPASTSEPGADLPDWLKEMGQEAPAPFTPAAEEPEAAVEAEMPEWLKEMSQPAPQPSVPAEAEAAEPAEPVPDWLSEAAEEAVAEPAAAEAQPSGELDDDAAFAWLESLAVKQGATDALLLSDEERQETPPEWVQNAALEAEESAAEEPSADQPALDELAQEVPAVEAQVSEPAPEAELPDWLMESRPAEAEPEAIPTGEAPELEAFDAAETPAEQGQPAGVESFPMDDDAAFAWLESLAVRQGAEEALLLNPEDRRETPPEWVSEVPADLDSPEAEAEAEAPSADDAAERAVMPDWIQELGAPVSDLAEFEGLEAESGEAEALPVSAAEPQEELQEVASEWAPEAEEAEHQMDEVAEPVAAVDASAITAAIGALTSDLGEPPSAETVPAWLDSAAEAESEQTDVPEWLKDLAEQETGGAESFAAPDTEPAAEPALEAQPASESTWEPEATQETSTQTALADALDRLEEEAPILGDTKPVRVRPAEPAPEPEAAPAEPVETTPPPAAEEQPTSGLPPVAVFMTPEPEVAETAEAGWQAEEPQAVEEPLAMEEPEAVEDLLSSEETLIVEEPHAAPEPFEELAAPDTAALEEVTEEAPVAEAASVVDETPAVEEAPAPETAASIPGSAEAFDLDSDAAFAWLESLAVKQGATDALLLTPEERQETPPEWVQAAAEEEAAAVETAAAETAAEEPALEPEEAAPVASELEEFPVVESATEAVTAGEAEALEWLKELEDEPLAQQPEPPADEPPVDEALVAEEPETAEPLAAEPPAKVTELSREASTEPIPDLPDWLAEAQTETASEPEWVPPADLFIGAPIDINQASLAELERLPGIGFILAQRIVTHRERTGPFESVDDLLKVPGFTKPTLDFVKGQLVVAAETAAYAAPTFEAPTGSEAFPSGAPGDLQQARLALSQGKIEEAAQRYDQLIRARYFLQDIIRDLNDAAFNRPNEVLIWQALGDAFMRNEQLQEALDAYTRAEELLR